MRTPTAAQWRQIEAADPPERGELMFLYGGPTGRAYAVGGGDLQPTLVDGVWVCRCRCRPRPFRVPVLEIRQRRLDAEAAGTDVFLGRADLNPLSGQN